MKNLIRALTFLLVMVSVLCCNILGALAEEVPEEPRGTIVIDYRYDGIPLNDVKFEVYQITSLDEQEEQQLLPDFQNLGIGLSQLSNPKCWGEIRENLENYINYELVAPDKVFYTDNAGAYELDDLDMGIYFIQAEVKEGQGTLVYSEPIMIMVGRYDHSEDKWIYHYTVIPKVAVAQEEKQDLTVKKVWKNNNKDTFLPKEIKIELHRDGVVYDIATLNRANSWTYTWKNVDTNAHWGVKEISEFNDFEVDYSKDFMNIKVTNTYVGNPDGELPQTGTTAYLVPIFFSVGILFLLLGVLARCMLRNKRCSDEERE